MEPQVTAVLDQLAEQASRNGTACPRARQINDASVRVAHALHAWNVLADAIECGGVGVHAVPAVQAMRDAMEAL